MYRYPQAHVHDTSCKLLQNRMAEKMPFVYKIIHELPKFWKHVAVCRWLSSNITEPLTHHYVLIGDINVEIQLPFVLRGDIQSSTEGWDGHRPAYRQDGKAVREPSIYPLLWKETPLVSTCQWHTSHWKMSTEFSIGLFPSNRIHVLQMLLNYDLSSPIGLVMFV